MSKKICKWYPKCSNGAECKYLHIDPSVAAASVPSALIPQAPSVQETLCVFYL